MGAANPMSWIMKSYFFCALKCVRGALKGAPLEYFDFV